MATAIMVIVVIILLILIAAGGILCNKIVGSVPSLKKKIKQKRMSISCIGENEEHHTQWSPAEIISGADEK